MEYKIIANPVAGKGKAIALIDRLRSILKERKAEFDFELTKAPGHAVDIARSAAERGWKVIVSLGGDGTISEVISGLVGTESALGVISCGKGNDIARSLGVPTDIGQAVNTLLTGEKRRIDIGLEKDQAVFSTLAAHQRLSFSQVHILPGHVDQFTGPDAALKKHKRQGMVT